MGRWDEASDVYQKSNWGDRGSFRLEKMLYLWSWHGLGIPTLLLFPWWVFGMRCELSSLQESFKGCHWDSFPCLAFLRVALWNAEGCPVPLSIALQTPSPCTSLASVVRSADVSIHWGSHCPSVLWDLFFPLFSGSNWLMLMKWSTGSWYSIKCIIRRAMIF